MAQKKWLVDLSVRKHQVGFIVNISVKTFADLVNKVEQKLEEIALLPQSVLALMGKCCESLGTEVGATI